MNDEYQQYNNLITSQSDQMITMADIINEHAYQTEKLTKENKILKQKMIILIFVIITFILLIIYLRKHQT
jgi:uncharacterized membrane protein